MTLKRTLQFMMIALAFTIAVGAQAKVKDSGNLDLRFDVTVAGAHLASGNYDIRWQSHSPEATVSFLQEGKVVATAEGKVVDRGTKYQNDGVVYGQAADGTRVIRELHFQGSREAIEFEH
ncbi:MAG: hypothetical protein WAO35_07550 [Terriglobia bacterium]